MNIVLLGYGKMGKAIETCLLQMPQHKVIAVLNSKSHPVEVDTAIASADVVIEFSNPSAVIDNIEKCIKAGKPIVVGTTGWYSHLANVEKLVLYNQGKMVYATNFSIGVNIFFSVNKWVAKLMQNFPNYEVAINETHHTQKLDAPSGTAITLANGIKPFYDFDIAHIQSHRIDNVIGEHTVSYSSTVDTISIHHQAHDRKGFAMGAITAAELIVGKKGFYQFQDLLPIYMQD